MIVENNEIYLKIQLYCKYDKINDDLKYVVHDTIIHTMTLYNCPNISLS